MPPAERRQAQGDPCAFAPARRDPDQFIPSSIDMRNQLPKKIRGTTGCSNPSANAGAPTQPNRDMSSTFRSIARRLRYVLGLGLLAACLGRASAALNSFASVDDLWSGFDPRSLPLDVKVMDDKEGPDGTIRKIRFTSEIAEGFAVQIAGYYGFPVGAGKHPAILHIHGGSQIASRAYVEYWLRRGYAVMSINWGGLPQGDSFPAGTDWGPLAMGLNDSGSDRRMAPDVRSNAWFHWAIACRRAITFLELQPEVDAQRIGIFGISRGGRLTWLLAGVDDRIKAAVSIYGAAAVEDAYSVSTPEEAPFTPEDLAVWRATLDAPAYAPRIKIPFFFLSAADDFYGVIDHAESALGQIPHAQIWRSYSPHYSHHVEPAQSASLPLWMERWLKDGAAWPATPGMKITLSGANGPQAVVAPGNAAQVRSVTVYYSTESNPRARFWRTAVARADGSSWTAALPLSAVNAGLWVYANVGYSDGLSLSTALTSVTAVALREANVRVAETPTSLIDNFAAGMRDWYYPDASTDPLVSDKPWMNVVDGPNGGKALQGDPGLKQRWRFATRKITDPQWRATAAAGLKLQMRADGPGSVLVLVRTDPGLRSEHVYCAAAHLAGGAWESVTLFASAFHDVRSGDALPDFTAIQDLAIEGEYIVRGKTRPEDRTLGGWKGRSPVLARCEWTLRP